jgi:hypothetical protein
VRRELKRAQARLREAWQREHASEAELATITLRAAEEQMPSAGSRPQVAVVDERGRSYLFKVAPNDQIAAELLASRVRAVGKQLHVPVVRRSIEIAGATSPIGMVQPRLEVLGELPKLPADWSPLQCEALLVDHPWEWLLANLDTHIDQYVLVGEDRLPLNIDWDHALVDLPTTELTRFNRRSATVIPVRNLLYADYVAGRAELDFYGMQLQAHRIREIPFATLEELLHRWADEAEVDDVRRQSVIEAMRLRHARIARDFDHFVSELRHERKAVEGQPRAWSDRAASKVQDAWQRFALLVLHDRVVRPVLSLRRKIASRSYS